MTTGDFIEKARLIHGYRYDYLNVIYEGAKTKISIICPEHGEFFQTPNNHLCGYGCPVCGKSKRMTLEEFIKKAEKIHEGKYEYSKAVYVNAKTKLAIICPYHGEFLQRPSDHLSGKGCRKCAYKKEDKPYVAATEETARKVKPEIDATEEFIRKAKSVHQNKYDYSETKYNGMYNETTIICPYHGKFTQKPYSHLNGHGCPVCNMSSLESETVRLLRKYNVDFECQKRFEWLVDKAQMPLDFYLPEYNIAIECQGEQHYEAKGGIFNEENVREIKRRDALKKKLCEEHGINIHYIPFYDDIKLNINNFINELNDNEQ